MHRNVTTWRFYKCDLKYELIIRYQTIFPLFDVFKIIIINTVMLFSVENWYQFIYYAFRFKGKHIHLLR